MLNLRKSAPSLLFLAATLLTSCTTGRAKQGYNLAVSDIKSKLKDPSSLRLGDCYYVHDNKDGDDDYFYKIAFDGKNSFGAYTGFDNMYYWFKKGESTIECLGESDSYGRYSMSRLIYGENKI
jgi:hypothetical protein